MFVISFSNSVVSILAVVVCSRTPPSFVCFTLVCTVYLLSGGTPRWLLCLENKNVFIEYCLSRGCGSSVRGGVSGGIA